MTVISIFEYFLHASRPNCASPDEKPLPELCPAPKRASGLWCNPRRSAYASHQSYDPVTRYRSTALSFGASKQPGPGGPLSGLQVATRLPDQMLSDPTNASALDSPGSFQPSLSAGHRLGQRFRLIAVRPAGGERCREPRDLAVVVVQEAMRQPKKRA